MIHLAVVVLLVACPACTAGNPPERVVQASYDALNRRDVEGVLASYAPNVVFVTPADSGFAADTFVQGTGERREYYQWHFQLFPEMRVEVRDRRVDGRTVVDELLIHGDPCGGTTRGIVKYEVVDGRIHTVTELPTGEEMEAVSVMPGVHVSCPVNPAP